MSSLRLLASCGFSLRLRRCRNTHDIKAYLAVKPRDVQFPTADMLQATPPYVNMGKDETIVDAENPSINREVKCPVFETRGECTTGYKCRFLGGHVQDTDDGEVSLVVDEAKKAFAAVSEVELNPIDGETLKQIRSKKV